MLLDGYERRIKAVPYKYYDKEFVLDIVAKNITRGATGAATRAATGTAIKEVEDILKLSCEETNKDMIKPEIKQLRQDIVSSILYAIGSVEMHDKKDELLTVLIELMLNIKNMKDIKKAQIIISIIQDIFFKYLGDNLDKLIDILSVLTQIIKTLKIHKRILPDQKYFNKVKIVLDLVEELHKKGKLGSAYIQDILFYGEQAQDIIKKTNKKANISEDLQGHTINNSLIIKIIADYCITNPDLLSEKETLIQFITGKIVRTDMQLDKRQESKSASEAAAAAAKAEAAEAAEEAEAADEADEAEAEEAAAEAEAANERTYAMLIAAILNDEVFKSECIKGMNPDEEDEGEMDGGGGGCK
jgi:hypothetical protein